MKTFIKESLGQVLLKALKLGVDITQSEEIDLVKLHNASDSSTVDFVFESQDYDDELSNVVTYNDHVVKGSDYVLSVLKGSIDGLIPAESTEDFVKIEGAVKGQLSRKHSYAIVGTNLSNIINIFTWEELSNLDQPISIDKIIKNDLVYLEMKVEDGKPSVERLPSLINSLIASLSYTHGVQLTNTLEQPYTPAVLSIVPATSVISIVRPADDEPIAFFNAAEKIDYPYLKFVEYYHVIEYYFLEAEILSFNNSIETLMTKKLINSSAELKNDSNYWAHLYSAYNTFGRVEKTAEKDQIKTVVNSLIGFDTIINVITIKGLDPKQLTQTIFDNSETRIDCSKIYKFSSNDSVLIGSISEDDKKRFCESIAIRIYKVRNHIIHTKKGEGSYIFTPTAENFGKLSFDLNLIRHLSYALILKKASGS